MPLFVLADLVLGAIAIAASVLLRFDAGRRSVPYPDDEVVRADLTAALRSWGAAVFLLGLLALGQFPGGFTLPIWSVLALGLGAIGALIAGLRWRVEGWALRGSTPKSELIRVESETWEFALIGWVAGLAATYVLGLLLQHHAAGPSRDQPPGECGRVRGRPGHLDAPSQGPSRDAGDKGTRRACRAASAISTSAAVSPKSATGRRRAAFWGLGDEPPSKTGDEGTDWQEQWSD